MLDLQTASFYLSVNAHHSSALFKKGIFNGAVRHGWDPFKTPSECVFGWISSLHLIVHSNIVKECIEMRVCMLLYLFCACDAIWSPLQRIICGVSVPHSARPQWGDFSQPSIQTWPITARLQKHFPCTQELTVVNGGYFQSLCCQSKCQVNTVQWKQLQENLVVKSDLLQKSLETYQQILPIFPW